MNWNKKLKLFIIYLFFIYFYISPSILKYEFCSLPRFLGRDRTGDDGGQPRHNKDRPFTNVAFTHLRYFGRNLILVTSNDEGGL